MARRSGGLDVDLSVDMTPLVRGVTVLDDRLDIAVAGLVKFRSHVAAGWMRDNAPWTDRTGNARSGIDATTEHVPKVHHTIWLFGRVPYQIWLEIRHAGKYAIIGPALLDQGKKLMSSLTNLIERLNGGLSQP